MNKGTILRTLAFVIVTANNFVAQFADYDFGSEKANLIFKVVSAVLNVAVGVVTLYYNNDFTEEACKGTALTRYLKEVGGENYIGEDFTSVEKEEE